MGVWNVGRYSPSAKAFPMFLPSESHGSVAKCADYYEGDDWEEDDAT